MRSVVRASVAAATAVLVGLGAASMASAASDPTPRQSSSASPSQEPSQEPSEPAPSQSPSGAQYGCLGATDGYGGPLPCVLHITLLTPVCDNDVPKLRYAVQAEGSPNQTVTITWLNPSGGANVVQSGLPLSGTVLWPGAVVGPDGKGADWPGWRQLADGTWVEGDEFDWVRPDVQVLFQVNPEATMTVAYPPSSPQCLTDPTRTAVLAADDQVLSATGSESAPVFLGAVLLVAVGSMIVALVAWRRRPYDSAQV